MSFFIKPNNSGFFVAIPSYFSQFYPLFSQFEKIIPVSFKIQLTQGFLRNHWKLPKLLSTHLSDIYISLDIAYLCILNEQELDSLYLFKYKIKNIF